MTITTITELKQEAYLLKNGERITFPLSGGKVERFYQKHHHYREYNADGSSLVFYDEEGTAYVVPIPGNTLALFESILQKAGYLKNYTMYVPLSNGFDTPELKDKWEAIKGRIARIA